MRQLVLALSTATALLFTASAADAKPKLTLKEKRIVKEEEKVLAEKLVSLNKKCGTKMEVSVDWASFKKGDAINKSSTSPCENAIGYIERVCRDDVGKEALKEGVKELRCTWVKKDKANHKLEKKVLTEAAWVKTGGGEYFSANPNVDAWLAENL